jgi:hypothetical protein
MKPPPGWEREMARIAAREDRFLVGRDSWDERDWKVQREVDAKKRERKARLMASLDPAPDIPPALPVAGFSLHDRTRDEERQRRIEANRNLEKAGVRPRTRW